MENEKSSQKETKSLSEKVEELFIDKKRLPRFSLPFIGRKYNECSRRIMVVYEYDFCVSPRDFKKAEYAAYNSIFFKCVGSLLRNPEKYRISPYALEEDGFELSSILQGVSKRMTINDVVIHRFLPYPKISVLNDIHSSIRKKAVGLFVELLNICQPTHILFSSSEVFYEIEGDFKSFGSQYGSLRNLLENRYIASFCWDETDNWKDFCEKWDDSLEWVQYFANRALENIEFRKRALDNPKLKSALVWDDEKIRYYGVNGNDFRELKNKPALVKEMLISGALQSKTMQDLLRPFETLKYAKVLYCMPDGVINDVNFVDDDWGWNHVCHEIALHDCIIKEFGEIFRNPVDVYGRAKIRYLSICLYQALKKLSNRLRLSYNSKKLAELRGFVEELVGETDNMYKVRKKLEQVSMNDEQKAARVINARKRMKKPQKETSDISPKEPEDKPIIYVPKKKSKKQLDHLARIRTRRWPNSKADNASVKEDDVDKKK